MSTSLVTAISSSQEQKEKTPLSGTIVVSDKVWKALKVEIARNKAQIHVPLVTKIRSRTWGIKSPRKKVHQKSELSIGSKRQNCRQDQTEMENQLKLT